MLEAMSYPYSGLVTQVVSSEVLNVVTSTIYNWHFINVMLIFLISLIFTDKRSLIMVVCLYIPFVCVNLIFVLICCLHIWSSYYIFKKVINTFAKTIDLFLYYLLSQKFLKK